MTSSDIVLRLLPEEHAFEGAERRRHIRFDRIFMCFVIAGTVLGALSTLSHFYLGGWSDGIGRLLRTAPLLAMLWPGRKMLVDAS